LKPAAQSETLRGMRWLIVGIFLGVVGVRIFDAITKHQPVVRPPPLELSEGGAGSPMRDLAGVRKLPMRIRVDAIETESRTLISERKDGVRIRSVVIESADIRNGFAEARFEQIKVGDMVNGSRVKRAEDEYEVLSITKFESSRGALDKQAAANLRARASGEAQEWPGADEPRR
jgi:hypothetical protein